MAQKKPAAPQPPEVERARRLEEVIEKGPRAPRSPHEFIQERMREERAKARPGKAGPIDTPAKTDKGSSRS